MPCTLYRQVDKGMGLCDAVYDDHIPTVLERERYCSKDGVGCPILRSFESRGSRLNVLEYLDTWSRPPPRPIEELSTNRAVSARWGEARRALPDEGGRERPPLIVKQAID